MYDQDYEDEEPGLDVDISKIDVGVLKALGISPEMVLSAVVARVSEQIGERTKNQIVEQVAKAAQSAVDAQVGEWVAAALARPVQQTTTWGEPKGDPVSIETIIADRAACFMKEKVNSRGETDSYNADQPRYMWAARIVAQDAIDKVLKPELDKVVKEMKSTVVTGISGVMAGLVERNFK